MAIFLTFFFLQGAALAEALFLAVGADFDLLGHRFFHNFSIIPEAFDNKFSSRGLDSKFSRGSTDGVALAGGEIDELNSFLVGDHTVTMIFVGSNSFLFVKILLDSELALVVVEFEIESSRHCVILLIISLIMPKLYILLFSGTFLSICS